MFVCVCVLLFVSCPCAKSLFACGISAVPVFLAVLEYPSVFWLNCPWEVQALQTDSRTSIQGPPKKGNLFAAQAGGAWPRIRWSAVEKRIPSEKLRLPERLSLSSDRPLLLVPCKSPTMSGAAVHALGLSLSHERKPQLHAVGDKINTWEKQAHFFPFLVRDEFPHQISSSCDFCLFFFPVKAFFLLALSGCLPCSQENQAGRVTACLELPVGPSLFGGPHAGMHLFIYLVT